MADAAPPPGTEGYRPVRLPGGLAAPVTTEPGRRTTMSIRRTVGAGDGACVVVAVGARRKGRALVYPVNETALRYGAGVEEETSEPRVAYARFAEDLPVPCPEELPVL